MLRPAVGSLLTVAAVAAAAAGRWLMEPWLGDSLPFFTFYFALILSAWYGGFRQGALSLLLGLVVGDYFFLDPRHTFRVVGIVEQLDALRFVLVGISFSLIAEALHVGKARAEAQGNLLRVTLASIGDAVITTDEQGRIDYMNAVALAVTGWTLEEARGLPLDSVFRIVNEETRQAAENPATRALREGAVVGLANHTVLIRKDGREIPIDDSAAPIRDETGRISGCILIFRDISERRESERRIYRLMIQLKEADRRKDEFLATLAHELRNPMAPLRNMLEIMKRAGGDSSVMARARETMDRQLRLMVRLVDDLMDVSRITRNKMELRREQVDLATVLAQAVEACRPLADSARHELLVDLPEEACSLHADPVRLVQVFGNLLNNACRYTPRGGRIRVRARREDSHAVVSIQDNGTGIPPDRIEKIFDMFTQVDRTLERSQGGLGIGLTLVKRLVQMHGGTIEARSDGEGRGAEFVVRLPLFAEGRHAAAPGAADRQEPSHCRRIVIVDDNRDSAASLATLLEITGHETHTAHDGIEAMEAIETLRPDVVLLDIGLPRLSGLEVCRRIRRHDWGRRTVLIALTGWGQEEDRRQSLEAGFDGHMVKPVDHAALMTLLERLCPPRAGRSAQSIGD